MSTFVFAVEPREADLPAKKRSWIGTRVQCTFFNIPENRFYGEPFESVVKDVRFVPDCDGRWQWHKAHFEYLVTRPGYGDLWMRQKELKPLPRIRP